MVSHEYWCCETFRGTYCYTIEARFVAAWQQVGIARTYGRVANFVSAHGIQVRMWILLCRRLRMLSLSGHGRSRAALATSHSVATLGRVVVRCFALCGIALVCLSDMAPKAKAANFRKLMPDDQATVLRQRAKLIQQKNSRRKINEIFDEHPSYIDDVQKMLESAGFEFTSRASPAKRKASASGVDDIKGEPQENSDIKQELGDEDADAGVTEDTGGTGLPVPMASRLRSGAGVQDDDPTHWAPHRYTRFETSSEPFMLEILASIEPVAYSKLAMQSLVHRGKDEKMRILCEHFEFATGLDRSFSLTGAHRHLPSLLGFLTQQREQEQRRARDLKVPGCWGARGDGIFELIEDGEKMLVQDKATKHMHEVPADDRLSYRDGTPIEAENCEINCNYSVSKATIVSTHIGDSIHVITLGAFGRKGRRLAKILEATDAESPPPKRFKKGEEDGAKEEPTTDEKLDSHPMAKVVGACSPGSSWAPPPPPPFDKQMATEAEAGDDSKTSDANKL